MLGFKGRRGSFNEYRPDRRRLDMGRPVVIAEVKYAAEGNPDTLIAEAFAQIGEKNTLNAISDKTNASPSLPSPLPDGK